MPTATGLPCIHVSSESTRLCKLDASREDHCKWISVHDFRVQGIQLCADPDREAQRRVVTVLHQIAELRY